MMSFLLRRFRWMALGAGVRFVARRGVGRSVDQAAAKIEDRLPTPVAKAVNALPGDVMKAGGAAVVSARAAQRSAGVAQRGARVGGSVAARVTRSVAQRPRPEIADRIRSAREAAADQAELDRRDLRSDFQRYIHGGGPAGERAATDALLDRRDPVGDVPLPEVPEPIRRGRSRFVAQRGTPEIPRVQRSYRRPQKRWDRPVGRGK